MPATSRVDLLCELNVLEQVRHVEESTFVQNVRDRGQVPNVHGVIEATCKHWRRNG